MHFINNLLGHCIVIMIVHLSLAAWLAGSKSL